MNIQSTINYYLGTSYSQQERAAGANYKKLYEYIKSVDSDVNPNTLLIGSIYTFIAIDGKFTEKEWNFVKNFIGSTSYDDSFNVISEFYCDLAQQTARDFIHELPNDLKEAMIELCIIVMCIDGRVDNYEASFLKTII